MPFYEYECSACKFYVEALQKLSDPPMKKCPSCKKPALKKLVSAPVFRLKGAGWYETDFKSDQDKKRNLVESPDKESKEPSASAKDDKKTDKPEAAKSVETAKPAAETASEKSPRSSGVKKTAPKPKPKAVVRKK